MKEITEVPVTITSRTAEEGIVGVPEACYELCGKLPQVIGEAAINQLSGGYDAVICDNESRLPTLLRRCDAMRVHFKFEDSRVSPMLVGESNPQPVGNLVDDAIDRNGVQNLVQAHKQARS